MKDILTVVAIWAAVTILFVFWWWRMMRHVRAEEREREARYPAVSDLRRRQLDAFLDERVEEQQR